MSLWVKFQPAAKKSAIVFPGPRHAGIRKERVGVGQRAQDETIPARARTRVAPLLPAVRQNHRVDDVNHAIGCVDIRFHDTGLIHPHPLSPLTAVVVFSFIRSAAVTRPGTTW